MKQRSATRFVLSATATALLGPAALVVWTSRDGVLPIGWALAGFLAMAIPAVGGGAWLAREHGRAGSRFVFALQVRMLVRLVFAALVAMAAATSGGSAISASIAGLAAGFLSVMVFEMVWFARAHEGEGEGVGTGTRA